MNRDGGDTSAFVVVGMWTKESRADAPVRWRKGRRWLASGGEDRRRKPVIVVEGAERENETSRTKEAKEELEVEVAVVEEIKDAEAKESDLLQLTVMGRSIAFPGKYLMFIVPVLWGSFGPTVRLMFSMPHAPSPPLFNSSRLVLSSLCFLPALIPALQKGLRDSPDAEKDREEVRNWLVGGIELGLYVFLANVFQVIGLQSTGASRAAFLNQTQTVIVPVLGALTGIEQVDIWGWASASIAIVGVAILSSGGHTSSSSTGDIFEVLSALFFSLYVLRIGGYATKKSSYNLVGSKVITQTVLSIAWIIWTLVQQDGSLSGVDDNTHNPWTLYEVLVISGAVIWNGLVTSALSGVLQVTGQRYIPASEAALILSTQPLWASAFAACFLGEYLTPQGLLGGGIILLSTLVSSLGKKSAH